MREVYQFLIILTLIKDSLNLSVDCERGKFYDYFEDVCQDCDNSCNICYDLPSFACIECKKGFKYDFYTRGCVEKCKQAQIEIDNQCVYCQVDNCIECNQQFKCSKCAPGYRLQSYNNKCIPDCPDNHILENGQCKYSCSKDFLDVEQRECLEKQPCATTINYEDYCNINVILNAIIYDQLLYTFDSGGYVKVFEYPSITYMSKKLFETDQKIKDWRLGGKKEKIAISISNTQINLIDLQIFTLIKSIKIPETKINVSSQILFNEKMYITPQGSILAIIKFKGLITQNYRLKEDVFGSIAAWDTKTKNLLVKNDEKTFSYIITGSEFPIMIRCEKCISISSIYLTDNIAIANYLTNNIHIYSLNILTNSGGTMDFIRQLQFEAFFMNNFLLPPNYILIYSNSTIYLYKIYTDKEIQISKLDEGGFIQTDYESFEILIIQPNNKNNIKVFSVQDEQSKLIYEKQLSIEIESFQFTSVQGFNKTTNSFDYLFIPFNGRMSVLDYLQSEYIQNCFLSESVSKQLFNFDNVGIITQRRLNYFESDYKEKMNSYFFNFDKSIIGYINTFGDMVLIDYQTEQLINSYSIGIGKIQIVSKVFYDSKNRSIYIVASNFIGDDAKNYQHNKTKLPRDSICYTVLLFGRKVIDCYRIFKLVTQSDCY